MTLSTEMCELLKEQFMGKRIKVKFLTGVDKHGKNVFTEIVGVCTFIGYNTYLPKFGFQVTVDRLPIRNVEIQNISLV